MYFRNLQRNEGKAKYAKKKKRDWEQDTLEISHVVQALLLRPDLVSLYSVPAEVFSSRDTQQIGN